MKTINRNEFDTEVLGSATPVVVDIFAEWCPPCKMLAAPGGPLEVAAAANPGVKFVKLDMEDEAMRDLLIAFKVEALPTLLFFKAGGNFAQKTKGLLKADDLDALVKGLL